MTCGLSPVSRYCCRAKIETDGNPRTPGFVACDFMQDFRRKENKHACARPDLLAPRAVNQHELSRMGRNVDVIDTGENLVIRIMRVRERDLEYSNRAEGRPGIKLSVTVSLLLRSRAARALRVGIRPARAWGEFFAFGLINRPGGTEFGVVFLRELIHRDQIVCARIGRQEEQSRGQGRQTYGQTKHQQHGVVHALEKRGR